MTTPQTRPGGPASAGVLLAGAGISGIGAGYRLQTRLPGNRKRAD
jgi:cation diffusion facilitator CzcD-associated flavoprotein CzcO